MTRNDIERAALAICAAREAGPRGCYDQMRAIAICIRNRISQGWHDADWLKNIHHVDAYRANYPFPPFLLDSNNRDFQKLYRDVDEIYFARRDFQQEKVSTFNQMPDMDAALGKSVYWAFIDRPFTIWFKTEILNTHKQQCNMGMMMFYE